MSNSALPKVGVQAVVEGIQSFVKDITSVNKAIETSGNVSNSASKNIAPFGKALDGAGVSLDGIREKLSGFVKDSVPFGNQLGGIVDGLLAIPLPALAAVAAIAAVGTAFIALGNRGAGLVGLAQTFDNVTESVGILSQQLLIDLRKASAGTISDFSLIEKANIALSGASGKLGEALGKNLPRLLEIARVQARATGKDIDFIFTSLVEGIRKSSPLRIDNAQLIIKVTAAEKAYAESVGKTAEQLTVEEKGIAILNATLESGASALAQAGSVQETNAEKIARANATITNTLDGLAIAVQPAFGVVLDAVQKVLNIFQQLAEAIGPIFGGILSIVANVFGTIVDVITSILQPIIDVISSIAPYFALAFQTIANIIGGIGQVISAVVGGIVKFLSDVAKNFFGLDLKNLGPQLFNGAAAAFGSFANGIIAVANKLIFPAVIGIAKFIADFLIGFSPPKKGPLSVIDKGGENIMLAWLDGISGVSLDPVKQVAQEVSDALGNIGKQGIGQVNARLAQLDKALLPFQNRLDIVKAQFEALSTPAQAALDAIDRQTAALQDAVAQGDQGAVEKLRVLDLQRDAIQKQLDLQQGLVDRAQIQLGLAKAQQAPERALLTIRKAYLDSIAQSAPKATTATGGAGGGAAEKKSTGAGAATPAAAGGAPSTATGDMPSVLDLIGGQGAVDAAGKGIQDAFMGAIDQSGLDQLAQNSLDLGGQLDRIKSVDLGAKITDKFKGLTDAFDPSVAGSVANVVWGFFSGDATNPNSLAGMFASAGDSLASVSGTVTEGIKSTLASIFDPTLEGSAMNSVLLLVGQAVGNDDLPGDVANFFSGLPNRIVTAVGDLLSVVKTGVFDPLTNFLIGADPGSINDIINQVVGFFAGLPVRIVDALRGIGAAVYSALAVPVIQAINGLIGLVESGIKGFITSIADFVGSISNALGDASPAFLKDTVGRLHDAAGSVNFGRISTELPAFLQAPAPLGGKDGGIFSKGFMKVGEQGTELMYNAEKMGVVPHELTNILMSLQSIMTQPQGIPVMAGGDTNTTNNSNSTFNFNGVPSDQSARQRFNSLRAGMR